MLSEVSNIKFTRANIVEVFDKLISKDDSLQIAFDKYIHEEYNELDSERLYYCDIAVISRYLVDKIKNGETDTFEILFGVIEEILSDCDSYIKNLIVVGLFEGIQNIGGPEINYYTGFDTWLKPRSKSEWDMLIDLWEGEDWHIRK